MLLNSLLWKLEPCLSGWRLSYFKSSMVWCLLVSFLLLSVDTIAVQNLKDYKNSTKGTGTWLAQQTWHFLLSILRSKKYLLNITKLVGIITLIPEFILFHVCECTDHSTNNLSTTFYDWQCSFSFIRILLHKRFCQNF